VHAVAWPALALPPGARARGASPWHRLDRVRPGPAAVL